MLSFPIFNDETLYLQYAQLINEDWAKNKFVSMDGYYVDWKPPLLYWMAAPLINVGRDPLVIGRAIALLFSVIGFFGTYAFAKELFGKAEGIVAAWLYVLCPTVLFHNNQFTAETFLFSSAPVLYWTVLKAIGEGRARWAWALAALIPGTALLLFKQSGFMLLAVALALPFVTLRRDSAGEWHWKRVAWNCLVVAGIIVCCELLAKPALPSAFDGTKARFNAKWVMTTAELLQFPIAVWRANLAVIGNYVGSYYAWSVPGLIFVLLWVAIRERKMPDLVLAVMCLTGAGGVCFLLRGFNEYLFNTAIIAALLPLLARTGVLIWRLDRAQVHGRVRSGLLVIAALTLSYWTYQIALIGLSAGRYIERSTPWAIQQYLKSWSSGFGVEGIIRFLENEKRPGVIFADAQWGNPRTAIEVYGKRRFRNLKIVPITREFLNAAETRNLRHHAVQLVPVRLAIYSAEPSDLRADWQANVEQIMCESRSEVKEYSGQTPLILCRF